MVTMTMMLGKIVFFNFFGVYGKKVESESILVIFPFSSRAIHLRLLNTSKRFPVKGRKGAEIDPAPLSTPKVLHVSSLNRKNPILCRPKPVTLLS